MFGTGKYSPNKILLGSEQLQIIKKQDLSLKVKSVILMITTSIADFVF